MKWVFILWTLLCICACNESEENDSSWLTLKSGLSALYEGRIDDYLEFVDSSDVVTIGKSTLELSIKQKYQDRFATDSLILFLDDVLKISEDTVLVKYSSVVQGGDTCFCIQKMVNVNGIWKIKII